MTVGIGRPALKDAQTKLSVGFSDNASTHKTPAIKRWLAAHPRFVLHFTPTSGSWLNLVERWFAELITKKQQRCAHHSVAELNADIRAWSEAWSDHKRPVGRKASTSWPS